MNRVRHMWVRGGIAVAVMCMLASVATSQTVQVRQLGQGGQWSQRYFTIPGLYQLGAEKVQKELELVDEQKQKLREIGKKYQEQSREAWAGWKDIPADQRQAKMTEIREKTQKMAEQARKDAEGVLLAHQLDALKKIIFRQRARYSLQNPRTQQEIGLDDAQKKQLTELRAELQKRMQELNEEMLDKTLKVLKPEQLKKLEVSSWQSLGRGYGYGGGIAYPARTKSP
jgi:Spy/CpxP family protein refolding chaperone